MGYQPSYLWRSIITARRLVEKGIAWQIGDGKRVKCYSDRWIGTIKPTKPMEKDNRDESLSTVSDLMHAELGYWNTEKIQQCFTAEDMEKILEIPISQYTKEDRVYWAATKNDRFSVKTSYHIAVEIFSNCGKSLASPSTNDKLWRQIWNVRIPPKVNHFLWRVCRDNLPTKDNLRKRRMTVDPVCCMCGEEMETTLHILFRCTYAIQVWGRCPIRLSTSLGSSTKQIIGNLFDILPMEGKTLASFILWTIWKHRNSRNYDGSILKPEDTAGMALHSVEEWRNKPQAVTNKHEACCARQR